MHNIKLSDYRVGIKFEKDPFAVEQNNYASKIVNFYSVYDLDVWPRSPTNNFKFRNCLFGSISVVKTGHNEKYVYSGHGITFDSAGLCSFDNDIGRNTVIFGVGNSSSHANNRKINFLVVGEGPTFAINGRFGSPEKKFSINFSKANTKFCFSLHYNGDNSYLFANGKEISKFKADNKNVNFPT